MGEALACWCYTEWMQRMIDVIARLRKIADQIEADARHAVGNPVAQAELIDIAMKWRWPAGEAAKLCSAGQASGCAERARSRGERRATLKQCAAQRCESGPRAAPQKVSYALSSKAITFFKNPKA